jgi:anti-sigma factor RsiW
MGCEDTRDLIHAYIDGELDLVKSLRIEQHIQNCQSCSLSYKNLRALRSAREHFINLFIWLTIQGSDKGEKTVTRQGYNLIHWAKSGMTYWAVSDLNDSELQGFVQLVQNQVLSTASP